MVPVFHSEAEMGTIQEHMRAMSEQAFGKERWERHRTDISEFWEETERLLEGRLKSVNLKKVRVYQDGQVVDGPLGIKIVGEVAQRGSKNHQLLLGLINRGAILMRTENFELLKEEYGLVKAIAGARDVQERALAAAAYRKRMDGLLEERDAFIAKNIAKTLQEGELGILFIGALHEVEEKLPPDVEVELVGGETAMRLKEDLAKVKRLAG